MNQTISKTIKFFTVGAGASEPHSEVAKHIKAEVNAFKPHVPLVMALRNRGMAGRHWEEISEKAAIPGLAEVVAAPGFKLATVVELGLDNHLEVCEKVRIIRTLRVLSYCIKKCATSPSSMKPGNDRTLPHPFPFLIF